MMQIQVLCMLEVPRERSIVSDDVGPTKRQALVCLLEPPEGRQGRLREAVRCGTN